MTRSEADWRCDACRVSDGESLGWVRALIIETKNKKRRSDDGLFFQKARSPPLKGPLPCSFLGVPCFSAPVRRPTAKQDCQTHGRGLTGESLFSGTKPTGGVCDPLGCRCACEQASGQHLVAMKKRQESV
jgi:hypothetical protein